MQSAASVSRHRYAPRSQGDYTLVHGGRQVRLGPVAFWIVVGTLVIMGVWSIATGTYFAFREDVLNRILLHRLATPEEIAAAVVFLASPGAAMVNGHPLPVDGGWTAI